MKFVYRQTFSDGVKFYVSTDWNRGSRMLLLIAPDGMAEVIEDTPDIVGAIKDFRSEHPPVN